MSAFTSPFIVNTDGKTHVCKRIELSGKRTSGFDERWLQELLFQQPGCIPVREIDPHIGTLIPICMELETGSGPADILYVTPTGQLVIVETKLWRNSEARRTVVAQILDYAKELTAWSYEDLVRQTAMASKMGPMHLLDSVNRAVPTLDEASFIDGINRSLRDGDFLLLIAGDGIRYGAETLVGFIERFGNLRFTLALLEVAAYSLPDQSTLLQPRILAKTELLTRTVFVGQTTDSIGTSEETTEVPADPLRAKQSQETADWLERFWGEFLQVLQLDDMQQPTPTKCRSTNVTFHQPPGRNRAWISTYLARSSNEGGVFLTFSRDFSPAREIYEALYGQREEIERIVPGITWQIDGNNKVWIAAPKVSLGDLDDASNRKLVLGQLAVFTNQMVNAFRNRLEQQAKERSLL